MPEPEASEAPAPGQGPKKVPVFKMPEPETDSEGASAAEELSESEQEEHIEDVAYVTALPPEMRTWTTDEDRDLERIRRLASHLREHPHVPASPHDKTFNLPWTDTDAIDSYPEMPYTFCPLKGCRFMKRAAECQRKDGQYEAPEVALLKHLKDTHRELFRRVCGEECVKTDRVPAGKYLAFLNQAQLYKATQGDMPIVGGAIDRRTATYWHNALGNDAVHCHMCFLCSERMLHVKSFTHHKNQRYTGEIEHHSWEDVINDMTGHKKEAPAETRQALFDAKWRANFDYEAFVANYMTEWKDRKPEEGTMEHGFVYGSREWMRRMWYPKFANLTKDNFVTAVCCPEDVLPSDKCQHTRDSDYICPCCLLPLCLECSSRLKAPQPYQYKIPAAIANDNFQGYVHPFMVQHRVRWVECVIACPYLTTMVQYYVEGKPGQKHHLGNERLGEHSRAMAFRGNIYAYHLPWEMILASAAQSTSQDFLKLWPQPPEVVCNLIKVLLVNTSEEHTLAHLKELHIRSFVLVGLARILIANGHEDMVNLGADPDASKAEQKEQAFKRYCDRVKHLYLRRRTAIQTPRKVTVLC